MDSFPPSKYVCSPMFVIVYSRHYNPSHSIFRPETWSLQISIVTLSRYFFLPLDMYLFYRGLPSFNFHWVRSAAAAAKSLQSCPTLCDPIDGSPPGSPVPGILQARTLEWVAISFSSAWKWKVKVKSLSRVRLLATSWTTAYQAPLSIGFSRQEYWSGVPLPSPEWCLVRLKNVCQVVFNDWNT